MTTGADRRQQPFRRRRDQHQPAFSRLLKGFEQRIGGSLSHRLGAVEHHQAARGLHRPTRQKARHVTDLLETQLGRCASCHPLLQGPGGRHQLALVLIGGLHPEHVGVVALSQAPPHTRVAAGTGQHPFEKTQRCQTAAHPLRARKQIGRRQPAPLQARQQQGHGLGLADQVGKKARVWAHRDPPAGSGARVWASARWHAAMTWAVTWAAG